MGQARDQAGNIWETDAQGNAVRLIQAAQSPLNTIIAPNPVRAAKEAQDAARQSAADALAERADQRAAAAADREQAKFESEDTMAPPPGNQTLTGDAYLATISPALAAQVRALSEGRRAFPTGTALRSPAVQQLIAAATQYDPTLDAANAATRVATRKKFTSGTTRDNITALNTALGHLGTLWQDSQKLNNFRSPLLNAPINAFESGALGDPRYTNFNLTRKAVADELERAFRGSNGSETGIQEWKASINNAQSPEQLRGAIGKAVELLDSRLQALSDAYSQGMGHSADPMEFLNPHAQQVYDALGPGGDGKVPPLPKDFGGAPPILGGGNTPKGPPPAPPTPPPLLGGDPQTEVATGKTRSELDPVTSAKLSALVKSGAPYADFVAAATAAGQQPNVDEAGYNKAVSFAKDNPGWEPVQSLKDVPVSAMERFTASPTGAFLGGASNAATAGFNDEIAGGLSALAGGDYTATRDRLDADKKALAALHPTADLLGNVVGGTGAMMAGGSALRGLGVGRDAFMTANPAIARAVAAGDTAALDNAPRLVRNPLKAAALGDAAYGGAYGSGENNEDRLTGGAIGSVVGLGGSVLGQVGSKIAGTALRGVVNPAVDRLRAAGIPLTAGEVLGGGFKKAQDAMTSVFGPGNMVARRYNEGREALNRAAFNEAGSVIDTPIDAVGSKGLALLDAAKGKAYSDALDPVMLNLDTPETKSAIGGAYRAAQAIPNADNASDIATGAIENYIGNAAGPDGILSGRDFQQAYRGLSRTAKTASPRIYGHEIGTSIGRAKDALTTALEEQSPDAYAGFLKANSANRHANILADALNAAKNQVGDEGDVLFTPAQLNTAATRNGIRYGSKIDAAMGNKPFGQLAQDAQQVMSSKVPDSGTPMRLLTAGIATGGLTGAGSALGYTVGGGEGAGEGGAATLAGLTLLGSRRGQQLLTKALLDRMAAFRVAGTAMRRNPQVGGDILAAAGIPLLAGP